MDNEKKDVNKLSLFALLLATIAVLTILNEMTGYISFFPPFGFLNETLFSGIGLVAGVISLVQIRKSKEAGKPFSLIAIVVGLIFILLIIGPKIACLLNKWSGYCY